MSPLVSDETWDVVLKENGFSGNDLVLKDTPEGDAHIVSIIVSTAVPETREEKAASFPKQMFVLDPRQDSQRMLVEMLSKEKGLVLSLDQLDRTPIDDRDIVVSLLEVDNALLSSLSETQFSQVETLFKQARRLIWVTAPRHGVDDSHFSHYAVAQGFLRTVRAEIPESHIVSLSIEDMSSSEMREEAIRKTISAAFGTSQSNELEYVFRAGQMHTARAVEDVSANVVLQSVLDPQLIKFTWGESAAVKLAVGASGSLEFLCFEQDDTYDGTFSSHYIDIEAKAWGLSQRDILTALARDDEDRDGEAFGSDCWAVVTRVGHDCDPGCPKPGDCVSMLARGCIRKYPRAHEACVIKVPWQPSTMSFEMAVAALEPSLSAYHALVGVARVELGDKVLVHEAASARGQMAVQIARLEGAEVLVTMSASPHSREGEEERQFLAGSLGIAPEHIFSSSHNTRVCSRHQTCHQRAWH